MKESKIPKFRRCVLQNFPFIEEDFDALTDYELLCKVVQYLNMVIDHQNAVDEKIDGLVEGFAELKSYVDNYFENLDVQEEINNKLEDMADKGELATIIAQFLALTPVFGFATISDMATAEYLADGCIARVLGNTTATDGDGAFYAIRTKTGADDPDGVNLVAIGDSLVAVRIQDAAINEINERLDNIDIKRTIIIGDSYALDRRPSIQITGWAIPLQEMLGLTGTDCYIIQDNGGGFTRSGSTGTFLEGLQSLSVTNKNTIKRIIICGGLNDSVNSKVTILEAISDFVDYCKVNYPNAEIYIGHIGNNNDTAQYDNQSSRYRCMKNSMPAYKESIQFGCHYLNGVENVMLDYGNYYDVSHPNQTLCEGLAHAIYQALTTGAVSVEYPEIYGLPISYDEVSGDNFNETTIGFSEVFAGGCDMLVNFPVANTALTFKTNKSVNARQIILGVFQLNYQRNVYPNFVIGSCQIQFVLSDDSVLDCDASLEIYNYNNVNYLVLNKPQTSSLDAKALRFRQFTFTIPATLC